MAKYSIRLAGALGINRDDEPHDLKAQDGGPIEWSAGDNIRFRDGYVERHRGWVDFVTPSIAPYGLMSYPEISGDYYWIYPGLDKIYVYDGTTHSNVTRQTAAVDVDYTGDEDDVWNGGILQNVAILNNGVDVPQYWPLPVGTAVKMANLANWDSDWRAGVIRPFGQRLVAGDLTKSGSRYPTMVKWSQAADPGAVPASWDEADPSTGAGEFPVGDKAGPILELHPMRSELMIYKEDSVEGMTLIGGEPVFDFRTVLPSQGILAAHMVTDIPDGRHVFVSHGDIVLQDGQSDVSILRKKWREILFSLMDQDYASRGFMVRHRRRSEVLFVFPESGETVPNKALVWNYSDNTMGLRDVPPSTAGALGVVSLGGGARLWSDDENITWDEADFSWGDRAFDVLAQSIVLAGASNLYQYDAGNLQDASTFRAWVERTGINLSGDKSVSTVTEFWPMMDGAADIYIASQMHPSDAISWSGPYAFDSVTDQKIDCFVTGIYHGIRIESSANSMFRLFGGDFHHELAGLR